MGNRFRLIGTSGNTALILLAAFTHSHGLPSILEPDLDGARAHTELLTQVCPQLGRRKEGLLKDLVQDLKLIRCSAPALDFLVCICGPFAFLGVILSLERTSVPSIQFGAGRRS